MSDLSVPILTSCIFMVVITLILFNIQRFLHELSHLIAARWGGVTVDELGFGYPPRIVKHQGARTLFTLNWLPLGSFAKMAGEKDPGVSDGFAGKSKKVRFAILIAGPIVSLFVIGVCLLPSTVLYALAYMAGSPEVVMGTNLDGEERPLAQTLVEDVVDDSPAAQAGLQPDDRIIGANGIEFRYEHDALTYVDRHRGAKVDLQVERDGVIMTIPVVPRVNPPTGQGPLGILVKHEYERKIVRHSLPSALAKGAGMTFQFILTPFQSLIAVLTGELPSEAMRPVESAEIYQLVNTANSELEGFSPWYTYYWMQGTQSVMIVFPLVMLTVISLLPIPGWDTWRLMSLLKRERK